MRSGILGLVWSLEKFISLQIIVNKLFKLFSLKLSLQGKRLAEKSDLDYV